MTDVQTRAGAEHQQSDSRGTASSRRAVLAGAGALGATCLLAACGTDTAAAPAPPAGSALPGTGTGTGTTGGGDSSTGQVLAAAADVPEGSALIKGDYVITQPTAGVYKAFNKKCTHQGCPVSQVSGDTVICHCHNSVFSVVDGSVKSGPAPSPLAETKVEKKGDNIVAA